jgi:hypothetical protein
MKSLSTTLLAFLLLPMSVFPQTYTTNFDGTENPISENGAWVHNGLDWKPVQKVNGVAFGTQTGTGGYDDSYAHLSGFPPNQSGSGVIQRFAGSSGIHEVEIHLRWSDSAHSAKGYECLLSYDASYAQLVRWNGPLGNFTYIGWAAKAPMPKTGDTFSASITGNLIVAYYNGVEIMRATDTFWHTGNPGMGFYRESAGSVSDMGFTSYTATAIGTNIEALRRAEPDQRLWLFQNQHGPFNQRIMLGYRLPFPGFVTLKIYDMLGREAATLLNETRQAGSYSVRFDAAALTSGTLTARLTAGSHAGTIKVLKVK